MKNSVFFFSLIAMFLISVTSDAQVDSTDTSPDFHNYIYSNNLSIKIEEKTYSDIKGSPYINEKFIEGTIVTKDGSLFENVPLRYNAFDDRIEYTDKTGAVLFLTKPDEYKEIHISDKTFLYGRFNDGKNKSSAYFQLICKGNISLLKRHEIILLEREPEKAYQKAKPAKFAAKSAQFYILRNENKIFPIKNTNGIVALMDNKKGIVEKYIKSNKLKTKKETDLIKIISYYNTL